MPNNVGVIPEFFFPDNSQPLLTKEFLENVPPNSRIVIYKGQLRKDCYIVIEDGNTRRLRAFADKYTFNECIAELETTDMTLSVIKPVPIIQERAETSVPKITKKEVNDVLRKLWAKVKEDIK